MNLLRAALVLSLLSLLSACSPPSDMTEDAFRYKTQVSVKPKAQEHAGDFTYYIRKFGEGDFRVFPAAKVDKNDDGSLTAHFTILLPYPVIDQLYETYYTYRLDGREIISKPRQDWLIRSTPGQMEG